MKTFPDTEVYLINWIGGSCGAFITTLLSYIIYGINVETKISNSGNFHDNLDLLKENWDHRYKDDKWLQNESHAYKHIIPKDPNKPLILFEHWAPSWNELFFIFPRAKNIIITAHELDGGRIHGNLFFKTIYDDYYSAGAQDEWAMWKNAHSFHFNNLQVNHPDDLPVEVATKIFDSAIHAPFPYKDGNEAPNIFRDKVHFIKMNDILYNKELILTTLGQITNQLIDQKIIKIYDRYLEKQEELRIKKMPWVKK